MTNSKLASVKELEFAGIKFRCKTGDDTLEIIKGDQSRFLSEIEAVELRNFISVWVNRNRWERQKKENQNASL
jgi:hypothetical protein